MPDSSRSFRLGLTGDVMLGRLVDREILADPSRDPAWVWGDTADMFRRVDARLINLECVIASRGTPDPYKVFCFRARPRAVEALLAAQVDFAGLANNHVLDYGPEALDECLALLRSSSIAVAGAGHTIDDAVSPTVIAAAGARVAVLALTDNEPGWEAEQHRWGVNFVQYDQDGLVSPYRERVGAAIEAAHGMAEFVVACAHVGPNWGMPSPEMQALAHQWLDLGVDLYWGHSNHAVQGIEFYGGRPILYGCGDFLDDYAVDPIERNDLSFFYEVDVQDGHVHHLRLFPVRVDGLRVMRAGVGEARWLARRMERLCAGLGTSVRQEDDGSLRVG